MLHERAATPFQEQSQTLRTQAAEAGQNVLLLGDEGGVDTVDRTWDVGFEKNTYAFEVKPLVLNGFWWRIKTWHL